MHFSQQARFTRPAPLPLRKSIRVQLLSWLRRELTSLPTNPSILRETSLLPAPRWTTCVLTTQAETTNIVAATHTREDDTAGIEYAHHRAHLTITFQFSSQLRVPSQVVTVCGGAQEACPAFRKNEPYTKTKVVHVGFDDPPALLAGLDTEEEKLAVFRRVRDEIEVWIKTLSETLPTLAYH